MRQYADHHISVPPCQVVHSAQKRERSEIQCAISALGVLLKWSEEWRALGFLAEHQGDCAVNIA